MVMIKLCSEESVGEPNLLKSVGGGNVVVDTSREVCTSQIQKGECECKSCKITKNEGWQPPLKISVCLSAVWFDQLRSNDPNVLL